MLAQRNPGIEVDNKKNSVNLAGEGQLYYQNDEYNKALQAFEQALTNDANNIDALIGKGKCLHKLVNYDQALQSLHRALEIDSKAIEAYNSICSIYLDMQGEQYERMAEEANKTALEIDMNNASAHNCRGRLLHKQGQYEDAKKSFEQAIDKATPQNNIAVFYYNKHIALNALGKTVLALDILTIAAVIKPTPYDKDKEKYQKTVRHIYSNESRKIRANEYAHAGKILCRLDLSNPAITVLLKATNLDPTHYIAYTELGKIYLHQKTYNSALNSFNTALHYHHSHYQSNIGKGKALYYLGHIREAIRALQNAIEINNTIPEAYIDLGNIYLSQHTPEMAFQMYEKAVQYGTDDASCFYSMGNILLSSDNYEQAFSYYDQAISQNQTFAQLLKEKAHNLFLSESFEKACKCYELLAEKNVADIVIYFRLGDMCNVRQKEEAARRWYEKGLEETVTDIANWSLLQPSVQCTRPIDVQIRLLSHYVKNDTKEQRLYESLRAIGKQYFQLTTLYSTSNQTTQSLQYLIEQAHIETRESILWAISQQNPQLIAILLIHLQSCDLKGLNQLAEAIAQKWDHDTNSKKIAKAFYQTFLHYKISQSVRDLFLVDHYLAQNQINQAESLLQTLTVQGTTNYEIAWKLIEVQWQLNKHTPQLHQLLYSFIASAPQHDKRWAMAQKYMGTLLTNKDDGREALQYFQRAEANGLHIPQLTEYRKGNWNIIPALLNHQDYVFPTIVVIDTENEYRPDAAPGTSLIEVGAVRMRGNTELATYNAVIRRDFIAQKVAHRQREAKNVKIVASKLQAFISETYTQDGPVILVGHNFAAFDVHHLRAIGITIDEEQIIDTLAFCRLLYPDILRHNLGDICALHSIQLDEAHNAIPDARANASLLFALGNDLAKNQTHLLPGFRAFTQASSAFDRAILRPRGITVDPTYHWKLDPAPAPLTKFLRNNTKPITSPALDKALAQQKDCLVEYAYLNTTYMHALPSTGTILITVGSRSHLEYLLANRQFDQDCYILPDKHSLLCAELLQRRIAKETRPAIQLQLYCLYQASCNRDAKTLYPFRIPIKSQEDLTEEHQDLLYIKNALVSACCTHCDEPNHRCETWKQVRQISEQHRIILTTHTIFVQHAIQPRDCIIVDDIDDLQMHMAEYVANKIHSETLQLTSPALFDCLNTIITHSCAPEPGQSYFHTRIPLRRIATLLPQIDRDHDLRQSLNISGNVDQQDITHLNEWLKKSLEDSEPDNKNVNVQAQWLDIYYSDLEEAEATAHIERWSISEIDTDIHSFFKSTFLDSYNRHIFCGRALSLLPTQAEPQTYIESTIFLKHFFGLQKDLPFSQDTRANASVYIPTREEISSASFLAQYNWALHIGDFLYRYTVGTQRSFIITLQENKLAQALVNAFQEETKNVISPLLNGYPLRKIRERLSDAKHKTFTIVSPGQRRYLFDIPADIEVSGPLRFLNQRDPLVAALLRSFAARDGSHKHSPFGNNKLFTNYLLPQALLELKSRISTPANLHIILDSSLRDSLYHSEIEKMLKCTTTMPAITMPTPGLNNFNDTFAAALEQQGYNQRIQITEEELQNALQNVWHTTSFRKHPLDQETIVKNLLSGADQMVVTATGGGKSLCYQLPAILLAQDYLPKVTLIISPLIALMRDQVQALHARGIFSAVSLDSMQSPFEQTNNLNGIRNGDYSIIYAAPEKIRSESFAKALQQRTIKLIAFDEAHCISEWGHNFRTDYLKLPQWIHENLGDRQRLGIPIVALTATARKGYKHPQPPGNTHLSDAYHAINEGTIEDIQEKLGLRCDTTDIMTSAERPELEFHVITIAQCPYCDRPHELKEGVSKCTSCHNTIDLTDYKKLKTAIRTAKLKRLSAIIAGKEEPNLFRRWHRDKYNERQRGIIYCRTKEHIEIVRQHLQKHPALSDLRISIYHGGLEPEEKQKTYEKFIRDDKDGLDIIIATNAFGMGIDVRRLGFVIHFDIPSTPEAYYQEAGRAGRDAFFKQEKAQCILLYHEYDINTHRYLLSRQPINLNSLEALYNALQQRRSHNQSEIFVSDKELERLSGIDEKDMETGLYYLQLHSRAGIIYKQTTRNDWPLKFTPDYQQLITSIYLTESAQKLIDCFQREKDFQLNEESIAIIQAQSLAEELGWSVEKLGKAKDFLMKNGIIARNQDANILWKLEKSDALALINNLDQSLLKLCSKLQPDNSTYLVSEQWISKLISHVMREQTKIPNFQYILIQFLTLCAQRNAKEWQILKCFEKTATNNPSEPFTLQEQEPTQTIKLSKQIFETLQNIIEKYAPQDVQSKKERWQYHDLLQGKASREEQQRFERGLLWLKSLNIIDMKGPEELSKEGFAKRIVFEKARMDLAHLNIDLTTLRQRQKQQYCMLDIMHEYATCPASQRMDKLNSYFHGGAPLLKPYEISANLNDEQKEYVQLHKGYHLITGPAGSGKTTVLHEHVRYLAEAQFVPVENIFIATHYRSAIERIGNKLTDIQHSKEHIYAQTLNGFGENIFIQNKNYLKQPDGKPWFSTAQKVQRLTSPNNPYKKSKIVVIEEDIEKKILASALSRQDNQTIFDAFLPKGEAIDTSLFNYKHVETYIKKVKMFRQKGIFPVAAQNLDAIYSYFPPTDKKNALCYYGVYVLYMRTLADQGYYTFDDQILFALAILRQNPDLAHHHQSRFEHIIVDEAQDLSPAQRQLINLLSAQHQNTFITGDDRQEIRPYTAYDNEGLHSWQTPQKIVSHQLTINYRSVQEILNLSGVLRSLMRTNRGLRFKSRTTLDKQIASRGDNKKPAQVIYFPSEEIATMIDAILKIYSEELVKTNIKSVALIPAKAEKAVTEAIKNHLAKRKCPYVEMNNRHEYQTPQAIRLLTYFRLILFPQDNQAMKKLFWNCCPGEITGITINNLVQKATDEENALIEVLSDKQTVSAFGVNEKQFAALSAHIQFIRHYHKDNKNNTSNFGDIWRALANLPKGPLSEEQIQADELEKLTATFSPFHNKTLKAALDEIDQRVSFIDESNLHNKLVLTTIDHAKSQEFDAVFLIHAHKLQDYARWYVNVTRARDRFFILVDQKKARENDKFQQIRQMYEFEEHDSSEIL